MPLIKSKSPKAFSKNIATEMEHGKPQNQSIAIAYSVKRKAAKKKASGGTVESGSKDMNMARGGMYARGGRISYKNDSAVTEQRPMPEERDNDAHMVSQNSSRKDNKESGWTDRPTERQAISNNGRMVKPIKHPKMVPSNAFSTRLRDEEDHMESSMSPGPYGEQPPQHDDEEGPNRQGPAVRDMEDEHSTHRRPYAKGGQIEASDERHPLDGRYEDDLLDLPPSEDEGSSNARSRNEQGPNRQGPPHREEAPHSAHNRMQRDNEHMSEDDYNPAQGKHSPDDSEDQPRSEAEMEHEDSIIAAIMSKRNREHGQDSDSDIDEQMMMARGGEILEDSPDIHSHGSMDTHEDADQVDLSRNADEDANEEDQASFNALRKENYSETPGLDALDSPRDSNLHGDEEESGSHDEHDMVNSIRRKMAVQRQFKQR